MERTAPRARAGLELPGTSYANVAQLNSAIVAFAREHDRRYVAITAIVFAVMCLSVVVGRI